MAVPTNTYQSVSVVGNFEDLANMVYNVDPAVFVLQTTMKKAKATNTYVEWLTEDLDSVDTANKHIQGDDSTASTVTPGVRLGNYTQIMKRDASVSGTNKAVDSAGGIGKMGHIIVNKVKALKRDRETILFLNQAKIAPTTSVAGQMAGIPSWLTSNISVGATGAAPTGDGTNTVTVGTARAFTQSLLDTVLLSAYQNTGMIPKLAFAAPKQKQAISQISPTGSTRFIETNGKKLATAFDIYVGDFGEVTIVPSIFQASGTVTLINPDYVKLRELRPFERTPLAKTGDSDRVQLLMESSLEVSNEKAHAAIYSLS